MNVTIDAIIKGAGFFVGNVEGTDHDTGQVFIEEPFDASQSRYKGFRTVEYKCLDSTVVTPVMHLPFPFHKSSHCHRLGRLDDLAQQREAFLG